MCVRNDKKVSGSVRVNIQNDKIIPGPLEDEFLLVAGRTVYNIAENTAALLGGPAACYVVIPPRTPQYIHDLNPLLTVVYKFLKFFTGLEIGDTLGGNIDGRPGFRIAAFA